MTRLADATRVAQVVTVDARTLLPERIVWQASGGRTIAAIDIRSVTVLRRDLAPSDAFSLALPPRTASHAGWRRRGGRCACSPQAASASPGRARCGRRRTGSGRATGRFPLVPITRYRYTGGDAVMLRYGRLRVWSYGPVVPPALLANLAVPVKQFPIGARTARLYATARGMFAVEVDRPGGTVVVIAPARRSSAAINALAPRLRSMAGAG